jgi:hypothetical protein
MSTSREACSWAVGLVNSSTYGVHFLYSTFVHVDSWSPVQNHIFAAKHPALSSLNHIRKTAYMHDLQSHGTLGEDVAGLTETGDDESEVAGNVDFMWSGEKPT